MNPEPIVLKSDARGWVFEPVMPGELPAQQNVHVVLNMPGCIRGNHVHPRGAEICAVQGPSLVRVREDGRLRDVTVPPGEWMRFVFPPGMAHAMQSTGDAPTLLISFNTVAFDPAAPDVVRDVLIPPAGA